MNALPSAGMKGAIWYLEKVVKGMPRQDRGKYLESIKSRQYPRMAPIPSLLKKSYAISKYVAGGFDVYSLTPKKPYESVVIYNHGGAYVFEISAEQWAVAHELSKSLNAKVIVPLYPLAPEYDNVRAFEFLDAIYTVVFTNEKTPVYFAGDSAGGGIALAQAIKARDANTPKPRGVILFSPWLDVTLANPLARDIAKDDPVLDIDILRETGLWWANRTDPCAPIISPLFDTLAGLPPVMIIQGTRDILLPDAKAAAQKILSAGGAATFHEYPGAFHAFVCAPMLDESKDAFGKVRGLA